MEMMKLRNDPQSDDYKVIRNHNPATMVEVYSLKHDSWKVILGPGDDVRMDPDSGVYMDGCCYWVTVERISTGTAYEDFIFREFILCFDFRTETFSRMPLPPPLDPPVEPPLLPGEYETKFIVDLFDCDGLLGAVGRKRVPDKSRVARHFELWVYRGELWERSFGVILPDVERPLELTENRFLEHAVYGETPSELLLLSYVENTVELPNAKPLIDSSQNAQDSSEKIGSNL
ncbi:hypothetical protein OROMI_003379 [Orobanche minor]